MVLIIFLMGWLILMIFLSHQNGYISGIESRWISERTRIPDRMIRRSGHIVVYGVFSFILMIILQRFGIDIRVGIVICVTLSIVDEATKPLSTFRHWKIKHELLNILGVVIGSAAAVLTWRV